MPDITAVRPIRRVYVGLVGNPYDPLSSVFWTQVPADHVKSTTLRWGAQHELAQIEPNYVSVLLDNRDGFFEPSNPSSFGYPNLRPLNRLRVIDVWGGVEYIRFTGYVTAWPRSWTAQNRATVTVEAYCAFGAAVNATKIPNHPWEMAVRSLIEEVPATGKATWLRLGESSGTVAADSSGYGLDGQYQGAVTLGVPGLIDDDADKAISPGTSQRVSLPYKNLISGYPCWFHVHVKPIAHRTAQRVLFAAYNGAVFTSSQYVEIFIQGTTGTLDDGKVVASVANPSPTHTSVISSLTVDDGMSHSIDIVMTSSTSFQLYVDGSDRTVAVSTAAHSFPDDLVTGIAIGNTPAVAFGDFPLALAVGDVIDEAIILDGYAPSAGEIFGLYEAAVHRPDVIATTGYIINAVLDAVGWPAADRAIDPGLTVIQPGWVAGTAVGFLQRLATTDGGRVFADAVGIVTFLDRHRIFQPPYSVSECTFGPGADEIGYIAPLSWGEDDTDLWNEIPVANVGQPTQVARDKASKDRYGWRTLSGLTDLLGTSAQEAQDRANRDLALYKNPLTRVREIVIKPQHEDPTVVWPALLTLKQDSMVTVKAQGPGSPLFSQPSHVEHYNETVTPDDWIVTLRLSPAETAPFWVLGTSVLGSSTRLAY